MSERTLRRKNPANRTAQSRALVPSPSPSPSPASRHRKTAPVAVIQRSSKQLSRQNKSNSLQRCKSEPTLWRVGVIDDEVESHRSSTKEEEILFRPQTCADLFSPPEVLIPSSPDKYLEGYNKDAKVVVNVAVEGSPGPIRTMVKLGTSIEETIKLVMSKYGEEGRTPRVDKDTASTYELYQSYFSLQSLGKLDEIGSVGSRSFYLRKCKCIDSNDNRESASSISKTDPLKTTMDLSPPSPVFLSNFVSQKISRIFGRMHKLWKIFGCLPCTG